MKHKKEWKIFGIVMILLIGFSLLPIAAGAFFEQLDWNNYLGAYQPVKLIFLPILFR